MELLYIIGAIILLLALREVFGWYSKMNTLIEEVRELKKALEKRDL